MLSVALPLKRWHMPVFGDAAFKEEQHPRSKEGSSAGQFVRKGEGGAVSAAQPTTAPAKAAPQRKPPLKARDKIASKQRQSEGHHGLYQHLEMLSKFAGAQGGESHASFVQKHGQPYFANAKTYEGKRGPMKMCYMNATQEAIHNPDRTYVEGYITVHGVPIAHAWTVDKTGQIYDPTINPDENISGYFGVPFSRDYLLKSTMKNKVYGLLGYASKTLPALLKGEAKGFKQVDDPHALTPEYLADRLAFADKVVHSIPSTDTIDTPERHALREKVADTLYNKDIEKRARDHEATIILGLPGAGKSTLANPLLDGGALEIEGDNAKALLPEFKGGIGAYAVHEEASHIMRDVLHRAVKAGDNIVWPRIDSPDKMVQDVTSLKKAGYKVHVKLVDVDPDVATESAINRFIKNGRYVPPHLIVDYGDAPKQAYSKAKEFADSSEVYHRGREKGFTKVEG